MVAKKTSELDTLPTSPALNGSEIVAVVKNGTSYKTTVAALIANQLTGSRFTNGEVAPGSPSLGDRWYVPSTAKLYTRINDGTTDQWVQL